MRGAVKIDDGLYRKDWKEILEKDGKYYVQMHTNILNSDGEAIIRVDSSNREIPYSITIKMYGKVKYELLSKVLEEHVKRNI